MATIGTKANGESDERMKPAELTKTDLAEWREMMRKVDTARPAMEDLAAFRALLTRMPDAWRIVGDLATQVSVGLVRELNGPAYYREAIEHGMFSLCRELGAGDAPPLERLLIDQVVLCWLRMYLAESWYSQKQKQGATIEILGHVERVLTMAQRRYLRAIEALARVRRLNARTPLQVNIGGQQINIVE